METYGTDTTKFHDIATWLGLYAAAPECDKGSVAAQWLNQILLDATSNDLTPELILYAIFEPNRKMVRDMVAALPAGELAVRSRRGRSCDNADIAVPVDAWLLNYLSYSTINGNTPRTENMSRVRNLWLCPSLEDRKRELFRLSDGPGRAFGTEIPPEGDVLLRNAVWDVARELGMEPDAVRAATRVTMESYRTDKTNKANPKNSDDMSLAILRILSHATIANTKYSVLMPFLTAKSLVVEHPTAALSLLYHIESSKAFSIRITHDGEATDTGRLTGLTTWLPGQAAYIAMARDVLGLRYKDVLLQLRNNEVPTGAVALPDLSNDLGEL